MPNRAGMEPSFPLPAAVVIPCFRVKRHIAAVLAGLEGKVRHAYVVDDRCPEGTGDFVEAECARPWITVLRHAENQGVGGAVMTGYAQALADGHEVVVKMDGDGQMDPAFLPALLHPILSGQADYTKGNRFFDLYSLRAMPGMRLFGNSGLSFVSKATTGYWDVMDPTNGYTAIHRAALERLPMARMERRYFFESDMLFRLGTIRAVVRDVPMPTIYGDEVSNLSIRKVLLTFPQRYLSRMLKRFGYMYLIRDFNVGSVETLVGLALLLFGAVFGIAAWVGAAEEGQYASTGTVMIAVLPLVVGIQLLLSALSFDIANVPRQPLQSLLGRQDQGGRRHTVT